MTFLKALLFIALFLAVFLLDAVGVILMLFYFHEQQWPAIIFYPAAVLTALVCVFGFAIIMQWLARRLV